MYLCKAKMSNNPINNQREVDLFKDQSNNKCEEELCNTPK